MVPEKPKRAFWVVHGLETAPQFHEKQNTETFWEGAGKTSATLWVPTLDRPHPGRTTEITDILSQEPRWTLLWNWPTWKLAQTETRQSRTGANVGHGLLGVWSTFCWTSKERNRPSSGPLSQSGSRSDGFPPLVGHHGQTLCQLSYKSFCGRHGGERTDARRTHGCLAEWHDASVRLDHEGFWW